MIDADKIAPGLYQGANPPAGSVLRGLGFDTVVLCAIEWCSRPNSDFPGLRVYRAPMWDGNSVPSDLAHKIAHIVAREIRAGHKVLVCCNMGWNRSGLVNALALWYLTGRSGYECMWHVQSMRSRALSNPAFALYLFHLPPRRARIHLGAMGAVRQSVGT